MPWIDRPKLSRDDEAELIERAQKGDLKARNLLVEYHLPLIRVYGKKHWCPPWLEPEDLVQAAVLGFLKAIDKFVAEKGFRLTTYAKWWMRSAIDDEKEFSRSFRVPSPTLRLAKNPELRKKKKVCDKTLAAVARFCGEVIVSDLPKVEQDECLVRSACLPEPSQYEANDQKRKLKEVLETALQCLPEPQRMVFNLWIQGKTFEEIGAFLGKTRQRAQQVHAKSMRRLRAALSERFTFEELVA